MRRRLTLISRQKIKPKEIKKILLLRPRRMGDIILTTPAIRALKSFWPKASLYYLLESPYIRLIEGNDLVDEVIGIQPNLNFKGFLLVLKKLRRRKFDVVIDFHGGPRSSFLAWGSGSQLRIGYKTKYRSWIYHRRVPRYHPSGPIHSVVNHLNLVRALGAEISENYPLCLSPSRPEERKKINSFWEEFGLKDKKTIALHISAGNRFRDWGKENFVSFLEKIASFPDFASVLIGSPEDKFREEEIFSCLRRSVPSLVGKTSLGELMAMLEKVDLFVGPDSGPMHLAAALNKPIVALFGPTIPAHFAPWQARVIILEKDFICRPCRQRSCPQKNYPCIRDISAEEVLKACFELLEACAFGQIELT